MVKPMVMGGLMGVMMLWMLHGAVTGDGVGLWAAALFVAAHVVLVALILGAAVFAARLSPAARRVLARVHRPSLSHMGTMVGTAVLIVAVVHLGAHGFGGV